MTELIVALDVPNIDEAAQWADKLGDDVKWYKVGLELFTREGAPVVKMLEKKGKNVFLDLKLHDIPRTVARTVNQLADLGVKLMTLHTLGGKAMIEAAAATLVDRVDPPGLLGVTVLTSMDSAALREIGVRRSPRNWVVELAMLGHESGLDGVVASPREIRKVKESCGPGFLIVTPGIRLSRSAPDDQKRTSTPAQAAKWGADFIVVGRPILEADNPEGAARKILKALSK